MTIKIWKKLKEVAINSDLIRHSKHSAAIVYKGKIIAIGKARYKTHPLMVLFQSNAERIYLHAEIDAIIKVINLMGTDFLKECDIFVLRLTKSGKISCSKPCDGCAKAISAFGFKHTYWSEENA